MNISKEQQDILESMYSITYYDSNDNEVNAKDATNIYIGISFDIDGNPSEPIFKSIKVPVKKEVTIDYIVNKLSSDKVYNNFAVYFNKLVKTNNFNAYPTTYGIGVFVLFGGRTSMNDIKTKIENTLNELGIEYNTDYSDARWVFRYKISRKKENIERIKEILQNS